MRGLFAALLAVGCASAPPPAPPAGTGAPRAADVGAAAERLGGELARKLDAGVNVALARLPRADGLYCRLGDLLVGRVEAVLSQGGKTLVERARLDALLAEQKLAGQGLIDDATAAELGNLAGAQVIVVGKLEEVAGVYAVTLRAVAAQSGKVLAVTQVDLPRDATTEELFAPLPYDAQRAARGE